MKHPIGGPRIWRRLVTRWWQPAARMQREWEARARLDAKGYIGRGYATSDALFWASGENDLTHVILRDIELDPAAAVLEIGCGVGRLLRPFAARAREVWGVDIAPTMIEQGRVHLAGAPHAHLHVTTGRLEMIPGGSLDFAYSFIVFQHIPSKAAISTYLAEVARTLKRGGIFKFQVDGRRRAFWRGTDSWLGVWYTAAEIRAALAANGFAVLDTWGEGTQYFWITAVRLGAASEPAALVKPCIRRPQPAAVEAVSRRLGHADPAAAVAGILDGRRTIRDQARGFLRATRALPPDAFVRRTFVAVLDREPDPEGLSFYVAQLAGGASHDYLMDCLLASSEFRDALST
jgi:SAM-dependent methyltransferase